MGLDPISLGAIGIGAGALGNVVGGLTGANAAQQAGQAQVNAANQAVGAEQQARSQGVSQAQAAATMSAGEINSINQLLSSRTQGLNQTLGALNTQASALNAMSPQIQAAGSNLYNLLTGQAAAVLGPMQTQQNLQRQQLMNQLSSQMGPGFMGTTAGIQAMTAFDQQSSLATANAQLSAMSQVSQSYTGMNQVQQGGMNSLAGQMSNAFGVANSANEGANNAFQANTQTMASATVGAQGANPIGFSLPVQYAGNPFAGQSQIGGMISGIGGALGNAGSGMLGMGALGNALSGMGGSSAGGTPNPLSSQIAATPMPNVNFGQSVGSSNNNPF